ncbi:MAG: CoB--CoM heterodisulfide reductase iron-sulfur subunit B family protein [Deltaproteobacteria bacterium]|nr:CoB--CoM heterodisulfide reductase iron-sulfur subunit B family protein [Deltaproteobacteria bacterium]
MTKYFLYSGCSLETSASNYLISVESVFKALGVELREIEDWNCCGASISYIGANHLSQVVLNARNLALAEAQGGYDIVAPCSSCYIVMNQVNRELGEDPALMQKVNSILAEGNLTYKGSVKVRHVLDVLYNDVGVETIKSRVKKPLKGVKVGGYVGCQTVRPYGEYDSVERPVVMDRLIEALGAESVNFSHKIKCCGSGIFLTELDYGYELAGNILESATSKGAKVMTTACPLCQLNLEAYQERVNKALKKSYNVPVTFITQLMAVAFGLDPSKDACLDRNIIPVEKALKTAA